MNTAAISLAVTPTVVSTFFSHYLNRKPLRRKPTAHLPYDEGLRLVRSFLEYAAEHTVEDLQAFTSQWVPHPHWVKVDDVVVPADQLARAAALLADQLGPDGVRRVGGSRWWQWRKPEAPELRAEWIEMRADHHARSKRSLQGNRIMLYVHGGAYYFGSVDEHRYQLQRHARKLRARVLAPRYRLAPQFPFPCALHDCLAAYLHLVAEHSSQTIVLAGDSAGGGMVLSLLVTIRDRGLPPPAGAVLISPWVDLTHSFPSVAQDCPLDYLPQGGFHHRPSEAWPPPDEPERAQMEQLAGGTSEDAQKTQLSLVIDGADVEITEQIQMYTTNDLLLHPLVSPIMQPTLGGLPPLLVMVGSGELLRDEQIYIAHKCANPAAYAPPESSLDDAGRAQLARYAPTDVQLQAWEDLCHVTPTLSFTRPAKHMFRAVAQFSAWALAKAQGTGVDIVLDDDLSVISQSGSDSDGLDEGASPKSVGTASDPLPPFVDHMIRQRVTRHGDIFPLEPPSELPGCCMDRELVGVVKAGPLKKWLAKKALWAVRYRKQRDRARNKLRRDLAAGFESFGHGECPPPTALAGRRKLGASMVEAKRGRKRRNLGLAVWSLWGSKHDETTVGREGQAGREPEMRKATPGEGREVESRQEPAKNEGGNDEAGEKKAGEDRAESSAPAPPTGVTGKRPTIDGIALPFSLDKEADTASMLTLTSGLTPQPMSPATRKSGDDQTGYFREAQA